MSKIFIAHPDDSDLKFFAKTVKTIKSQTDSEYLFLGPNNSYHEKFLNTLKNDAAATVVFLCHGQDKIIRGCNRESSQRRPFNYGPLITNKQNLEVFTNKKIFCMACSSKNLGSDAISAGAKVFLGFDNIRFHNEQRKKKSVIDITKFEIRSLIEQSLLNAIKQNQSFNQLSANLRYLINKRRSEILIQKKYNPYLARQTSIVLASLAKGVVLFGNGEETFC